MKKKSRIEIAREIVSRVKEEMNKPRLAESVRIGLMDEPAQPAESTHVHTARA